MKILNNIKSETVISIDLESVRIVDKFEDLPEGYQSAWEYKNKQDGEIPEYTKLAEMWEKNSSLYAEFSKVCAVSLTLLHGGKLFCKEFYGTDEVKLLESLAVALNKISLNPDNRLVGHASKFFDYPYLSKRYIINGLKIPNILDTTALKPWEGKNLCTNELWKCGGTGAGSSLQALCNVLNIPISKVDLIGDEVGKAYFNDELERIGRYCSYDTIATFNVIRRFKDEPIFQFEDVEYVTGYVDGQIIEKPTPYDNLLKELYATKDFSKDFQGRLKKQLKAVKMKATEKETVAKLIKASYLEKVDVMSRGKKELEVENKRREALVDEFMDKYK